MIIRPATLLLLVITGFFASLSPSIIVNADRQSYVCPSSPAIVCLSKGTSTGTTCSTATRPRIVLAVSTGCLIPDQQMGFKMFGVYANNTILFDATSLWGPLGYAQNIMVFQVQAYGNGTMDIRVKADRAALFISADAPTSMFAQASWGQGPEIAYRGSTTGLMIVQWIPVGGACFPACLFGSQVLGILIPVLVVLVASVLAVVYRERKRLRTGLSLTG